MYSCHNLFLTHSKVPPLTVGTSFAALNQVRIRVRKICKALEEDSFRPVLHHYDGPKFRLELSVPEVSRKI